MFKPLSGHGTYDSPLSSPLPPPILAGESCFENESYPLMNQHLQPISGACELRPTPLKTNNLSISFDNPSFLSPTDRLNLPFFRGTPSPGSRKIGLARRLILNHQRLTPSPFELSFQDLKSPFQSLRNSRQVCISKIDEQIKFNQSLKDLISGIQSIRNAIRNGFSSAELDQRVQLYEKKLHQYQLVYEKISQNFEIETPNATIFMVKGEVSLANALLDPPKEKKCLSELKREKIESGLTFRKEFFLTMAIESLKQSLSILKGYERAKKTGYPLPDRICMPVHQEQITNRMRFVGTNFQIKDKLGEGAWGFVRLIDLDGKKYAIKTVKTKDRVDGYNNVYDREIMVPLVLDHKNIVKIFAIHQGNLIMEYLRGGSLEEYFARECSFKESKIVNFLAEIASALAHMHARGLIHKDIKPANIMLKYNGNDFSPVIIDFGSTVPEENDDNTGLAGTPLYMAPEMLGRYFNVNIRDPLHPSLTSSQDVWALGHIIYQMVTRGVHLFEETGQPISLKGINKKHGEPFDYNYIKQVRTKGLHLREKNSKWDRKKQIQKGIQDQFLSDELMKIAADCLKISHSLRPQAKEVEMRLLDVSEQLKLRETSALTIKAMIKRQLLR
ncbi:MAG: serine/threonine-protein kinase [Chlamydiae bacterium]|nr:serine/threonine-protein kinase [Chlamydiota bacterium]